MRVTPYHNQIKMQNHRFSIFRFRNNAKGFEFKLRILYDVLYIMYIIV